MGTQPDEVQPQVDLLVVHVSEKNEDIDATGANR